MLFVKGQSCCLHYWLPLMGHSRTFSACCLVRTSSRVSLGGHFLKFPQRELPHLTHGQHQIVFSFQDLTNFHTHERVQAEVCQRAVQVNTCEVSDACRRR